MIKFLLTRQKLFKITKTVSGNISYYYQPDIDPNPSILGEKFRIGQTQLFEQLMISNINTKILSNDPFLFEITGYINQPITRDMKMIYLSFRVDLYEGEMINND